VLFLWPYLHYCLHFFLHTYTLFLRFGKGLYIILFPELFLSAASASVRHPKRVVYSSDKATSVVFRAYSTHLFLISGDVSVKCGHASAKRGDVSAKRGDASAKRGNVSAKCGDASAKCGDVSAKRGDASAKRGDASAKRGNVS